MIGPRRIVLTGGPGAGKTALLEQLAQRGFRILPEAARAILRDQGGLELRARNPDCFAQAIFEREITRFYEAAEENGSVFFDRGLGDLCSMPIQLVQLLERIASAVDTLRYERRVFRAPAWKEIYRQDDERTHSWYEAVSSDLAVTGAWLAAGYEMIDLPMVGPAEPADFVLDQL